MAATAIPIPNSGEVVASSWGAAVAGAHNGIQSGVVNVAIPSSAQNGKTTVTFPRAFSAPPVVVATSSSTAYYAFVSAITATTVDVFLQHRDGTAAVLAASPVQWVAIGLP